MVGRQTLAATAWLAAATAIGTSAQAETGYRAFYDMTEDQQGAVIRKEADRLIDEAKTLSEENKVTAYHTRMECITALFGSSLFNPLKGRLPEGWKTLNQVIEYERTAMYTYNNDKTVEDAILRIAELFCPPVVD